MDVHQLLGGFRGLQLASVIWANGFGGYQTVQGGADASGVLYLESTNSATKGRIEAKDKMLFDKTAYFATVDNGNSGTADTIDWTAGNKQKTTWTGNCTYTFTPPDGPAGLILRCYTGAGGFTPTFPANVKWPGGTTPSWTTTASRMDLIAFDWDGTDYFGTASLNYTP